MSSLTIAGPTRIGERYTVERQLGYGATATVYLCRDEATKGLVAVKVLRHELAESVGADRFLREIRLTSDLDHPTIVPVIDSGADGSLLYCVLPYLEGGTLRDVLRASRQLPIPEAVEIGVTIAGALEYAHGKGLIHRDIKPENILFSNGRAYLGDFGIARVLHATGGDMATTTTGVVRGTPAYMSPEQASGERNYDGRSDIYSLACVVYETVSGMPPFVGPTAQSVLAQRFSTTPRPMATYRNSVSAELERVIARAMATAPADRYSTAREFADQLDAAGRSGGGQVGPRARWSRRSSWLAASLLGAAVVVALIPAARPDVMRSLGFGRVAADTSQVAVMPFERQGATEALGSVDALLYDAFSAWRGLTVLEPYRVREAMRRSASGVGDERVAMELGAGRFVTGSINSLPAGQGWLLQAWLYEVGRTGHLASASLSIRPADVANIGLVSARLVRRLLLPNAPDSADVEMSTSYLEAMRAFASGIEAVDEWNLARADTAFERAIVVDAEYRRAQFWQAQVRAWQGLRPERWEPLVAKALADTTKLPERDRLLAGALRSLAARRYQEACASYSRLAERNPDDFAAQFGLGQCHDMDVRIVADAGSPTGWRYVASYQEAMRAYQRAFRALSLSHRSLSRGAFEPLRELLFLKPSQLRAAVDTAGSSGTFFGRIDLAGDTLVMRPIPVSLLASGGPAAVPEHIREAIESQRDLFRSIAFAWSTALPRSSGAKEAVAVALEMRGDPSARDTLRAARMLTTDSLTRLRLAVAELLVRVKFAAPDDEAELAAIRNVADSLLALPAATDSKLGSAVSPVAVLRGRCRLASDMIAKAPATEVAGVARDVVGAAEAFSARVALGCQANPVAELKRMEQRVATSPATMAATTNSLFGRAVRYMQLADPAVTAAFAQRSSDYLLRAQLAARAGEGVEVRRILGRIDTARSRTGYDDVSPDAVFLESRVLLSVGDTAAAVSALDRLIQRRAYLTPGMLHNPVALTGYLRAADLRARIAQARSEQGGARRWDRAASILWANGDAVPTAGRQR